MNEPTYYANQQQAIRHAMSGDVIINGGAGYGKTTVIKGIIDALRGSAVLMAPTGKAACRLSEATGYSACTIHRALSFDGETFRMTGNFDVPVIIDEASMVDSVLMAEVLSRHPPAIILVGDEAQLPPVGHGQPFHDLITLRPEIVHTLSTCYRATGAIHRAASRIRAGERPEPAEHGGGEYWSVAHTGNPTRTVQWILDTLIQDGRYRPESDIFLSPQHGEADRQDGGIRHLNVTLQEACNKDGEPILNRKEEPTGFRVNDRCILLKNFASDDLWNGDLGTITAADHKGYPFVRLDRDPENVRHMDTTQARHMDLAYCLSVHKAQGSQFERVFFVTFRRHAMMLTRPLTYTGVTRAQKVAMVIGETNTFFGSLGRTLQKRTLLQYRAGTIWRRETEYASALDACAESPSSSSHRGAVASLHEWES